MDKETGEYIARPQSFKDGGKMCGCGKTACEGGCKMYEDGGKIEAKRALRKAVRKAKRDKRKRELDRDPVQIFFDETKRKGGTKAILKGLGGYGKSKR